MFNNTDDVIKPRDKSRKATVSALLSPIIINYRLQGLKRYMIAFVPPSGTETHI